ncbi:MAG: ABC transporter substrate-binding protein [Spirochaetaceae bacterium]|jgi:iron complex transport system substrate-binding protein|nr:ABC transporter substrate-binding protein [Spirochaetaceae bacterium]
MKFFDIRILFVVPALMLTACTKTSVHNNKPADSAPDLNSTTAEYAGYKRIISTAPSNTDIIAALGMAGRLVAIDKYAGSVSKLPPEIPRLDFLNPDAETLIALEPDLIIAHSMNEQRNGNEPLAIMKKLGVQVVYIKTSNSLEGIQDDIMYLARLLGVPERGDAIIGTMREEIDKIRETGRRIYTEKRIEPRTVYFEIEPAPHATTFGSGVFLDEIITLCGAKNIFADQKGFFVPNSEEIIHRSPSVILTNASEVADPIAELYARTGFENTSAHKNKRIYYIDTDASARPTHNVIKALKQIAFSIYPEYYNEY